MNTQTRYYHGTASTNLESILRDGLIPHKGFGADAWLYVDSRKNDNPEDAIKALYLRAKRPDAVFLAKTEYTARTFATFASMINEDASPVILELSIPKDFPLVSDFASSTLGGWMHEGPIAAQYITRYHIGFNPTDGYARAADIYTWPKTWKRVAQGEDDTIPHLHGRRKP